MKNNFKYTPLAIMIASALSLSGCDSNSNALADTVNSNSVEESNVTTDSEKARVKLAVKFPEADAVAAWIGDSKSIEVSFFNTKTVGQYCRG